MRGQLRDGLDRPAGDLLAAVEHRADQEDVILRPTEILAGFDLGTEEDEGAVRQAQAMVEAQTEIVEAGVQRAFLPKLAERRTARIEALSRERQFLAKGLNTLIDQLASEAMEAFGEGELATGERLTNQKDEARQRKQRLLAELTHAEQLLLTAPEVLGVALILPAPLEVEITDEHGTETVFMRRDDDVEKAAMNTVMAYEREQGRFPKDVHKGNSWDVESYDAQGNLLRYIEVKGRGPEDANVASLTEPEWEAARRLKDQHWLYIIRLGDGVMWMIQNPHAKLEPREIRQLLVKIGNVAALGEAVRLGKNRT